MTVCQRCKLPRPDHLFGANRRRKSGFQAICRACAYEYRLQRVYGVDLETYAWLVERQDRECPGCRQPLDLSSQNVALDHCHQTGRVRGVLCAGCNTKLGVLESSPEILTNLRGYLAAC